MYFLEYTFVLDTYCQQFVIVCLTHRNVIFVILETPAYRKYSKGRCICVLVYLYVSISVFVHWTLGNIIFDILEPPALQINTQVGYTSYKTNWAHTLIFSLNWTIWRTNSLGSFLTNFCHTHTHTHWCWWTGAYDALMLMMNRCCWSSDAADSLMLLM